MKLFDKKNECEECHPYLPSGEWDGFYCYNNSPKQHEMKIELSFNNTVISGSGVDDVANFTWKGKYDVDKFKIFMTKTYPTHRVYYMGNIDENGIWGTWKISFESYNFPKEMRDMVSGLFDEDCAGGFHIWPKKSASESATNVNQNESKKLKELYVEIFN